MIAPALLLSLALPPEWTQRTAKGLIVHELKVGRRVAGIIVGSSERPTPDARSHFARRVGGFLRGPSPEISTRSGRLYATTELRGVRRSYMQVSEGGMVRILALVSDPELAERGEAALAELAGLRRGGPAAAPAPVATTVPAAKTGPLPAARLGGARIYVMYRYIGGGGEGVSYDLLVLMPDGTAVREWPKPLPSFTSAALRAAVPAKDVGRWSAAGGAIALTFPDGAIRLRPGSGGLVDANDPPESGARWNVYFPATPSGTLAGRWSRVSVNSVGAIGTGITFGGSSSKLTYQADGSYGGSRSSFATSDAPGIGSAAGGGSRALAGRWRLDGPLLTRAEDGWRGIVIAFRMPKWSGGDWLIDGDRWEPARKP